MYRDLVKPHRLGPSLLVTLVAIAASCTALRDRQDLWSARHDSSQQAPDPDTTCEPVIQVYAARARGWRGILGVHTWIAVKRGGAPSYTRYEVIGWGVDRGLPAVRVNRTGPDNYWFGERPDKLVDLRGERARRRHHEGGGGGGRLPVSLDVPAVAGAEQQHVHGLRRPGRPRAAPRPARRRPSARTICPAARSRRSRRRAAPGCSSRSSVSAESWSAGGGDRAEPARTDVRRRPRWPGAQAPDPGTSRREVTVPHCRDGTPPLSPGSGSGDPERREFDQPARRFCRVRAMKKSAKGSKSTKKPAARKAAGKKSAPKPASGRAAPEAEAAAPEAPSAPEARYTPSAPAGGRLGPLPLPAAVARPQGRRNTPRSARPEWEVRRRSPVGVVRLAGIEPATLGLEGRCSIRLSYRRVFASSPLAPEASTAAETDVLGGAIIGP